MGYWLHRLPRTRIADRAAYLSGVAAGRTVLHLGCADAEILDSRLASDELLHSRLCEHAASVAGLDIDETALAALRHTGFSDLHTGSVESLGDVATLEGRVFQVLIAGELIEHLRNPGQFLDGVARFLTPDGVLVITTPNGLRIGNLIPTLVGVEVVHPNHVTCFTPATLTRLLEVSGFEVTDIRMYRSPSHVKIARGGIVERLGRLVYAGLDAILTNPLAQHISPYTADGLIIAARARQARQNPSSE